MEGNRTAIVITLQPDPVELWELCGSLGLDVVETFVQRRNHPDPRSFIGPGKLEEIAEYVKANDIGICVFNGELSPSTMYLVETALGTSVYDRVRVILEIFKRQAASEEARLQVDMAILTQELPVLREWVHRAKVGDRPGFMAGGEYDVRQYYTARSRRKKDIVERLEKLGRARELRRASRLRQGLRTVSLAGYTNAGKTALMNALTEVDRPSEERLFTTLSTTTRRVKGLPFPVLLTDTIGFMEDLPPWLLESFRSTLEEVLNSDLMLLVVDVSDGAAEMARKLRSSGVVIWSIGASATILPVFNKADLVGRDAPDDGDDAEDGGGGLAGDRTLLRSKLGGLLKVISRGSTEVGDGPSPPSEYHMARAMAREMAAQLDGGTSGELEEGAPSVLPPVLVSARTGYNMDRLLESIRQASSPDRTFIITLRRDWRWQGMLSLLHDQDGIIVEGTEETDREVRVRAASDQKSLARALKAMERKFGEVPKAEEVRGPEDAAGS